MVAGSSAQSVRMVPDQVTYYFQQQQQQHQAVAQPTANTLQPQIIQLQVTNDRTKQFWFFLILDWKMVRAWFGLKQRYLTMKIKTKTIKIYVMS